MNLKITLLLLFVLGLPALNGQSSVSDIDAYLQYYKSRIPIPGFSVVIVEGDQVVFSKAYGVEKAGFAKPMSIHTPIAIGSVGRGFTAVAIMQLVEKGLLDLDEPVVKYLPWFATANKDFGEQITVRMCLNNTSGLPAMRNFTPDLDPAMTLEKFVRSMRGSHVKRKPGSSHEFSDEGYSIAGMLISAISGMPYEQYMDIHVFQKLQMKNTTVDPSGLEENKVQYGHELGLKGCIPAKKGFVETHFLPAGAEMRASSADLGNYLVALLNGGTYKGATILSSESVEELFSAHTSFRGLGTMLGGNGLDIEYALGWMGMTIEDRPILIHTGNTGTMASIIGLNRNKNQGIAILFNGDVNRLDRYVYPTLENTANNVIHILNEEDTTDFAVVRFDDPFDEDYELPREKFSAYTGAYASFGQSSPFFKEMDIEIKQGDTDQLELVVQKSGNFKGRYLLQFSNESRAVLRSIAHPTEIQFKLFPNGIIGGLYMFGSEFMKKEAELGNRFSVVTNNDKAVSFLFPQSARHQWNGQKFTAQLADGDGTDFAMSVTPLSNEDFDTFVNENISGSILSKGFVKNESIRSCIWTEQSISADINGEQRQFLFARFQDPIAQKQAQIIIELRWGSFTSDLQEILMRVQNSLAFQPLN